MAKRSSKRAARAAEKAAKKHPKLVAFLAVLLIIVIIFGAGYYFFVYKKKNPPAASVVTDELSFHFMEVGNGNAGDCILVKINDTEVLIDGGSERTSPKTTAEYIDRYCTDGVLEYVIVTHADSDHIAGFAGTSSVQGLFRRYECKTIIDFARTDKDTLVYQDYVEERDAAVEAGAVHYTALQCWNNADGAQRSYQLADNVTMNILYNYYYEHNSDDENNYSVCVLFTQGTNNYLFTGDLEEKGEEYLVENNDLPQCKLYKAGHHGSKTSSNDALLSVIRPEIVCVTCCAGSPEYTTISGNTFPTQAMIDRVGKYTDKIYVTTLATNVSLNPKSWDYTSMNGNIVVKSTGGDVTVTCSGSDTVLKDTEWFKNNRVWNGV